MPQAPMNGGTDRAAINLRRYRAIAHMFMGGARAEEVAAFFNVERSTVRRALRKVGVPPQKGGRPKPGQPVSRVP